jgi:ABC-type transport system substrate-binding protein
MPSVSRNGMLYTFKLRPNVKFHHGRTLVAADVKYTLERLTSRATNSEGISLYNALPIVGLKAYLNQRTSHIKGIRVIDSQTFTIQLDQPESVLLPVLSLPFSSIVPQDVIHRLGTKTFNKKPIGTGPFKVTSADLNSLIVFDRNPTYWETGLPYVDRVHYQLALDQNLAVLRVEANQQDMTRYGVPTGLLNGIRHNSGYANRLHTGVSGTVYIMTMSLKNDATASGNALSKLKVRQALSMAIDKQSIVAALGGLAHPADGGLFGPKTPYYQPGLGYPYDPATARKLLAEAGYPNGFTVNFLGIADPSESLTAQQIIHQNLAAIGVKMNDNFLATNAYLTAQNSHQPPGLSITNWDFAYPHGSYLIDPMFTSAGIGSSNYTNYNSSVFDAMARRPHLATNPVEIVAEYRNIDRYLIKDHALAVPLWYDGWAALTSSRTHGYFIPSNPTILYLKNYWLS